MNEIVNMFVLAGDKFLPGVHLRQLGFTYSAFGLFTKKKRKEHKNLKKQEIHDIFIKTS